MLKRWTAGMPQEWCFDEEHATSSIRGAALPMGFNRQPHYTRGLLLVGDAGGMINPFNGEGIAYALESGEVAADIIVQALARPTAAQRERTLYDYPQALKEAYGGYYTLGRLFVSAIGNPKVMKFATRHGLPHPTVMRIGSSTLCPRPFLRPDPRGSEVIALPRMEIPAMTCARSPYDAVDPGGGAVRPSSGARKGV
jgi:2-polyprenyl-6-methoxyphenol hydroxylase-like FAD-dependent oxidoreductase